MITKRIIKRAQHVPPQKNAVVNELLKKWGPLYVMAVVPKDKDGVSFAPFFVASTKPDTMLKLEELLKTFKAVNEDNKVEEFVEWLEKKDYIVLNSLFFVNSMVSVEF